MPRLIAILFLLTGASAMAQESDPSVLQHPIDRVKTATERQYETCVDGVYSWSGEPCASYTPWKTKSFTEIYLYGGNLSIAETDLNPSNRTLQLPKSLYSLDVRENLTVSHRDTTKFVVRPRYLTDSTKVTFQNPDEEKTVAHSKVDLTDGFVEHRFSEKLATTIGVQVYQWGPGELLSPSNPIFHFNSAQRSAFYKEKGHSLIRFNYSTETSNTAFIVEPVSNNGKYWIDGKTFTPQALVKFEQALSGAGNYVAAVSGMQEGSRPFVGGYFNHAIGQSGYSVYYDGRYTKGILRYFPVQNSVGNYDLLEVDEQKNDISSLQLFGLRYEGAIDLRFEYIYNSAGYTPIQIQNAISAASTYSSTLADNASHFQGTGLELLSINRFYTSLRIPNLGSGNSMNIYLRHMFSPASGGGNLQFDIDRSLGDFWVVYFEAISSYGPKNTEYTLTNLQAYEAGLRFAF